MAAKDLTVVEHTPRSRLLLRPGLAILTLLLVIAVGCSQTRSPAGGGLAFEQPAEKHWWEWWKPAEPEPTYHSEALRKAMAGRQKTQKSWWDWWTPSPPDPGDPQYVAKQQKWIEYQQKKQLKEFAHIRQRHQQRSAELNENQPSTSRTFRDFAKSRP